MQSECYPGNVRTKGKARATNCHMPASAAGRAAVPFQRASLGAIIAHQPAIKVSLPFQKNLPHQPKLINIPDPPSHFDQSYLPFFVFIMPRATAGKSRRIIVIGRAVVTSVQRPRARYILMPSSSITNRPVPVLTPSQGTLVQCDPSIKAIISKINEEHGGIYISEDIDDETCLINTKNLKELQQKLKDVSDRYNPNYSCCVLTILQALKDTVREAEDSSSE